MTTINISDTIKIEIDQYNHTLMKFVPGGPYVDKKTREEKVSADRWETMGYYPNVEQALSALTRRFTNHGDLYSVGEYYQKVSEQLSDITEYVKRGKV